MDKSAQKGIFGGLQLITLLPLMTKTQLGQKLPNKTASKFRNKLSSSALQLEEKQTESNQAEGPS